jgi:hypothetical protein
MASWRRREIQTRIGALAKKESKTMDNSHLWEPEQPAIDDTHPFPVDLLYEPIRSYVIDIATALNLPCALPAIASLGTVSASLGKGLEIQTGPELIARGNIFAIPAAKSGTGKTIGTRALLKPLFGFQKELTERWKKENAPGKQQRGILELEIKQLQRQCASKEDKSQLKQKLTQKYAELDQLNEELKPLPQLVIDDTTVEAAAVALAQNNEQIFSFSSDAGKAIQNLEGRYAKQGSLIEDNIYLRAHSGDYIVVNRISRDPIILDSPCMTLLWFVQPDLLERLMRNPRLAAGGFLARCLICNTKAEPTPLPASLDDDSVIASEWRDQYDGLIWTLCATYLKTPEPLRIPYSNEASRLIRAYHNGLVPRRRNDLSDINAIAARWHEQVWRVMIGLHAVRHGPAAQRAIGIVKWNVEEALQLLQPARDERQSDILHKLIKFVEERHHGVATLRELARHGFSHSEVKTLVETFPNQLAIETPASGPNGGRPSPTLRIISASVFDSFFSRA